MFDLFVCLSHVLSPAISIDYMESCALIVHHDSGPGGVLERISHYTLLEIFLKAIKFERRQSSQIFLYNYRYLSIF